MDKDTRSKAIPKPNNSPPQTPLWTLLAAPGSTYKKGRGTVLVIYYFLNLFPSLDAGELKQKHRWGLTLHH